MTRLISRLVRWGPLKKRLPACFDLRLKIAWRALTEKEVAITIGESKNGGQLHYAVVPMPGQGKKT